MRNLITSISIAASITLSSTAFSAPNNTPTGNPARAVAIYDYRDFGRDAVSSKTYALTGFGNQIEEVREWSSTVVGDNTEVLMVQRRFDAFGTQTLYTEYDFLNTPTSKYLSERRRYNPATEVLTFTLTYDSALLYETSTMREGATFAANGTGMIRDYVDPNQTDLTGLLVEERTAVGVEDVTTTYGSFSKCLKISQNRKSDLDGEYMRIDWRCPGLGLVKRVQVNTNPYFDLNDPTLSYPQRNYRTWDLTNVTYTP
jgi:hypothetical protein